MRFVIEYFLHKKFTIYQRCFAFDVDAHIREKLFYVCFHRDVTSRAKFKIESCICFDDRLYCRDLIIERILRQRRVKLSRNDLTRTQMSMKFVIRIEFDLTTST